MPNTTPYTLLRDRLYSSKKIIEDTLLWSHVVETTELAANSKKQKAAIEIDGQLRAIYDVLITLINTTEKIFLDTR